MNGGNMIEDPDVASVAGLMAVPARAEILLALMHGQSRPAGELARFAGLSPQAATAHLKKLVSGGLLTMLSSGRHRYYRLTSPEVAHAIEALMPLPALRGLPRIRNLPSPFKKPGPAMITWPGSLVWP